MKSSVFGGNIREVILIVAVYAFVCERMTVEGIAFRKERYVSNTTDYCTCRSACEEYSFNATEYANFGTVLAAELQTNDLLKRGWEKAKTLKKSHPALTENEILAVVTYTLEYPKVYDMFNFLTRTRGIKSDTYFYKGMHFFLSSAIHKLAVNVPQSTIRCESAPNAAVLSVGNFFSFKQFASSTADYYSALQFGDFCLNLITLRGAHISSLSAFPEEKEILIPSCETFQVVPLDEGYMFYSNLRSTGGIGNHGTGFGPGLG